jgi:hypothetical protein
MVTLDLYKKRNPYKLGMIFQKTIKKYEYRLRLKFGVENLHVSEPNFIIFTVKRCNAFC